MKKIFTGIIVAAVVLTAGCSKGENSGGMSFEKAQSEREVALAGGNDAPSCKVMLEVLYAKSGNAEADKAVNNAIEDRLFAMQNLTMQQAVDSFANSYTADYKQSLTPLYEVDKADPEKHAWYEYHYTITTKTQPGKDNVVVYVVETDCYEGGAHGIQQQLVMNFNTTTGEQLKLANIFVPGYERRLSDLLLEKLMDQLDVKTLYELKQKDYLYAVDMFPTENFMLGEDELTFIYNTYEIAPYSAGRTELKLKWDEVEDLLKR